MLVLEQVHGLPRHPLADYTNAERILVLAAFSLALDALVGRVERRLLTWQPRAVETEKL